MLIAFISDTHGRMDKVVHQIPPVDLLIHCGDMTSTGTPVQLIEFGKEISKTVAKHKIVIPGNHDFLFEEDFGLAKKLLPDDVVVLNDSGITIMGYKIWGSPITPTFMNWAFMRERGEDIKRHWDMIPDYTDILVTHGPPMGMMDEVPRGEHVGCEELLTRVEDLNPLIHAFGHIHEERGVVEATHTTFINASSLNGYYEPYPETVTVVHINDETKKVSLV